MTHVSTGTGRADSVCKQMFSIFFEVFLQWRRIIHILYPTLRGPKVVITLHNNFQWQRFAVDKGSVGSGRCFAGMSHKNPAMCHEASQRESAGVSEEGKWPALLKPVSSHWACHHLPVISDAVEGKGQHWRVNQNSLIRDCFNYQILCEELLCHISHFTVFHMLFVNDCSYAWMKT